MAVIASFDDYDLVVNPHELSTEDRAEISKAIQECRKHQDVDGISREILQLIQQRRLASAQLKNP